MFDKHIRKIARSVAHEVFRAEVASERRTSIVNETIRDMLAAHQVPARYGAVDFERDLRFLTALKDLPVNVKVVNDTTARMAEFCSGGKRA